MHALTVVPSTHWVFLPFFTSVQVAFCQPFIKLRRRWWWTNSLIYPYGTTKKKDNENSPNYQRCLSKHKPRAGRQNWPWPSNSSDRGTKRVFPVNMAQIRSAVPQILYTQTKKVADSAKDRTLRSSLRAVKKIQFGDVKERNSCAYWDLRSSTAR